MTLFHLLLGAAGHHGRRQNCLGNAGEFLSLQREERLVLGT